MAASGSSATDAASAAPAPNVDAGEVARFAALAARWWDEDGPAAPLHRLNPARLDFIRRTALVHFGRPAAARAPFTGLAAVDVGCGGGLVAEPLMRMGFSVLGIDADETAIAVARRHAAEMELGEGLSYRVATAEALVAEGAAFDLVCCLELIEHVPRPRRLVSDLVHLARPGGLIVLSTLNRTARSFLAAILGAEYLLGWLPRGTHDWNRFLKPEELAAWLAEDGAQETARAGIVYDACRDRFRLGDDTRVNYLVAAVRNRR
ncbi:MAG: ubiquinone biosynthesis O-methyltransferase [Rhodothalassiaceae bacterium]|nr:MAG: ubiquinone biosynthesis O-methyltransferase [Rhodothalassiaceae bacterium]